MENGSIGKKVAKIIALQGDPYTGKTTIANSLARKLKCPVIHFDDILDIISPHPPTTSHKAETLMSKAFHLIACIVTSHTSSGQPIVVDSPLSRRSHLDNLLALDSDDHNKNIVRRRLVIVECKPTVPYVWETRFKAGRDSTSKWYKPREWPHGAEFSRDYTDNDVGSLVSKVVVDTTINVVRLDDLAHTLERLAKMNKGEWVDLANDRDLVATRKKAHDSIMNYMTIDNPNPVVICLICEKKINHQDWVSFGRNEGNYGDRFISLAIHKSCAELGSGVTEFTPKHFPTFFVENSRSTEQKQRCNTNNRCREYSSRWCDSCLFTSHLKSRSVPTIVNHKGHFSTGHPLCFWLSATSSDTTQYSCAACYEPGDYLGYGCLRNCGVGYHAECALLPTVVQKHRHGGYTHDLEMVFHREKALEEYFCSLCEKEMNPKAWYYCCQDCQLEFHLPCAFQDFIPQ